MSTWLRFQNFFFENFGKNEKSVSSNAIKKSEIVKVFWLDENGTSQLGSSIWWTKELIKANEMFMSVKVKQEDTKMYSTRVVNQKNEPRLTVTNWSISGCDSGDL